MMLLVSAWICFDIASYNSGSVGSAIGEGIAGSAFFFHTLFASSWLYLSSKTG
jgi:hypothetical protein